MPASSQPVVPRTRIRRSILFLVVIATVTGTGLTQFLEHSLFMNWSMLWYHLVSGLVDVITLCTVLLLYFAIRQDATRLQQAYENLRASEALRQDLVSMLVHDLRNPLASALGALQVLSQRLGRGQLEPAESQMLQVVTDSQHRINDMIGDMLEISRAEEGRLELQRSEFDLSALIAECVSEFAPLAQAQHVTLITETTPATVCVDRVKIGRVIENLLANALKFTPSGGTIRIGDRSASNGSTRISVSDTGPGIPPEKRTAIFDKFGQLESRALLGVSVGLGLTFCRLIMQAHNGRIWVDDAPGGGSVFTAEFPAPSPDIPCLPEPAPEVTS